MLVVKDIEAGYGKLQVLWGVSLEVREKEIVCLLGPNGAGKTTLVKTIAGLIKPMKGEIYFKNNNITGLDPYKIAKLGIAVIPETRELFPYMTVQENILMGLERVKDYDKSKERIEIIFDLFPRLKDKKKQLAKTLSGGEQQMLAIARALISKPDLLILDEPSTGLAPKLALNVFQAVSKLREEGLTIFLVEQNVKLALDIADRAYVLENGNIVLSGYSQELKNNEIIKAAYLGY